RAASMATSAVLRTVVVFSVRGALDRHLLLGTPSGSGFGGTVHTDRRPVAAAMVLAHDSRIDHRGRRSAGPPEPGISIRSGRVGPRAEGDRAPGAHTPAWIGTDRRYSRRFDPRIPVAILAAICFAASLRHWRHIPAGTHCRKAGHLPILVGLDRRHG